MTKQTEALAEQPTQTATYTCGVCGVSMQMEQPAQPQQEPVAWMYDWICEGKKIEGWIAHKESEIPRLLASNIRPLYTTPQPAQRKPLTDEQIDALREKHSEGRGAGWRFNFKGFARAIEAKLKEKNT